MIMRNQMVYVFWLGVALIGIGFKIWAAECSAVESFGSWITTIAGTVIMARSYYTTKYVSKLSP